MLKKLKREDPYAALEARVEGLASRIERESPVRVQRFASLFWVVFGEVKTADGVARAISDIPAAQKETYARAYHQWLAQGIYLAPSGFEVSFLATVHTDEHLDRVAAGVKGFFSK
jgi:glutamate-1-semialdehyde 2,1-aminomutase